ncbi:hypothetical protein AWM75_05380 [Aerococcus urinaehominis]|uniref:UPF0340 protein AWM75_05380 n=1 Tax=Aerococcus urinaehominis TaxID=128944 RepID=A0A109RI11_9LACT|nr:TIGR01440 family protein [Aerococcus urinaehominis]AMB99460.1 hypothetical protein AWM75_05380 [Aerococcus urinaehominis]SDM28164.1 TIGR01440 family protein [Aerococcus urinaehominis]
MDLTTIAMETRAAVEELLDQAQLKPGDIFVLGLSTSEVQGHKIGKHANLEVGRTIIQTILDILDEKGIYLAVQGCEHTNRAISLERVAAEKYGYEIVNLYPALNAGGAGSVAAFECLEDPVCIEHVTAKAGIDIGDTAIGMHVKFVQVPVRLQIKTIGQAHVTALRSRPKYIGGPRATYDEALS